jgi:hypothetical protein
MTAYNPLQLPIDSIILGGMISPGIAKVVGAASRRKVDVRGAYGISASVAVWLEVAEFKVEIYLYNDAHWGEWHIFRTEVLREIKANTRNKASDFALDIWHPWLEELDIKSVIVKSVSQPEETEPTVYRITLEFIEYRKASLTLSKPEASKEKPKDKIDQLIDANSERIKNLNNQLAE